MQQTPYSVLQRKRDGGALSEAQIRAVVTGAADGSWTDAQLAAFLMAAFLRGLDDQETIALTRAMLESGEQWDLAADIPGLGDKHSTGGVGDKVSLVLAPLLAACGLPVVMLTGRGLGHTAGTADKLDVVPGLDQTLDRPRCVDLLRRVGMAVGIATRGIAPADRRLYALRDSTATVESLPLITASILSKKLATGAQAVVFDVKTGNGAFLSDPALARRLAHMLVATSAGMGRRASALLTDMSQPLGCWVGHAAEVRESLDCLAGRGPEDLMSVVRALALELAALLGAALDADGLERALSSGAAREQFDRWAAAQGGATSWLEHPELPLAPVERVLAAPRDGVLAHVDTRRLGLLLAAAGAGRRRPEDAIDHGISLRYASRLGERLERGEELARVYLRRGDEQLERDLMSCFTIGDGGQAPALILERIGPATADA